MPNSYSVEADLTCHVCNHGIDRDIWLIVDIVERPDLLKQIQEGSLNYISCPNCDFKGLVDWPLLIFHPHKFITSIIFSPSRLETQEKNEEDSLLLLEQLRENLGDFWSDNWLDEEGLLWISRPNLADSIEMRIMTATMYSELIKEYVGIELDDLLGHVLDDDDDDDDFEFLLDDDDDDFEFLLDDGDDDFEFLLDDGDDDFEFSLDRNLIETPNNKLCVKHNINLKRFYYFAHQLYRNLIEKLKGLRKILKTNSQTTKNVSEIHSIVEQLFASGADLNDLSTKLDAKQNIDEILVEYPNIQSQWDELLTNVPISFQEIIDELLTLNVDIDSIQDLNQVLAQHPDLRRKVDNVLEDVSGIPLEFRGEWHQAEEAKRLYIEDNDSSALDEASTIWEDILEHPSFAALPKVDRQYAIREAGLIFHYLYSINGQLEDLERAIQLQQQALQITPSISPHLPSLLNILGLDLHARFQSTNNMDDLEESILILREASQLLPSDSPDLLNNLGNSLGTRYDQFGEPNDLEEAILLLRRSLQFASPDLPDLPTLMNTLGILLYKRYKTYGHLEDLEEAIDLIKKAIDIALPNSVGLLPLLVNAGMLLNAHYKRSNDLNDLDEAIQMTREAVEHISEGSPTLPGIMNSMGVQLQVLYRQSGNFQDLDEAIYFYNKAIQYSSPDSPHLPGLLNNWGSTLIERYDSNSDLVDLEKAIEALQKSVTYTSPDSPNLPQFLNNLGNAWLTRYKHQGNLADLTNAIRFFRDSIEATESISLNSSNLVFAGYLSNLGKAFKVRYSRTAKPSDLSEAIHFCQRALTILDATFYNSSVIYQLGQQSRWYWVYAQTVDVLIQAGQTSQALTVAETNKSRILHGLLTRNHLISPQSIPEDIWQLEQTTIAKLNDLELMALTDYRQVTYSELQPERYNHQIQRNKLLSELSEIWDNMSHYSDEAREYVALRRGSPLNWNDINSLVHSLDTNTAVLSLFTVEERTLIFIFQPGWETPHVEEVKLTKDELVHLYLKNYSDEIINRQQHWQAGRPITGRWRELGKSLLSPLLPYLVDVKHLIIVPSGVYHTLPLHALSLNHEGETLFDKFAVSYVPSLGVLDRLKHRRPLNANSSMILGYTHANPQTRSGEQERNIFLGEAVSIAKQMNVTPFLDKQANSQNLATCLQDNELRLVHLSCHGFFAPDDPLNSGVLLADGAFTAKSWMTLSFRADLVTLSACQTGLSAPLGGNEFVGLSQALLQAGASSLLVGLWSVNAQTTAKIMLDFYRRLWGDDGQNPISKAEALRESTMAFRRGELIPPDKYFDPDDPYYWAPFVLVGDFC